MYLYIYVIVDIHKQPERRIRQLVAAIKSCPNVPRSSFRVCVAGHTTHQSDTRSKGRAMCLCGFGPVQGSPVQGSPASPA